MTEENVVINWRSVGVKRERYHETLLKRLESIFTFKKDLMIFAAMIGKDNNTRKPLSGDCIEISLDTYADSEHSDGFIYLLAIMEHRDGLYLKDNKMKESVRIFEEYCNAGLYEIESWLDYNPGDPIGVDTVLNKIYERLAKDQPENKVENNDIEIKF